MPSNTMQKKTTKRTNRKSSFAAGRKVPSKTLNQPQSDGYEIDLDTIDPTELVLLRDFGKKLRISYLTVRAYWEKGRKNTLTGKQVHLATCRTLTGRATTMQAYREFLKELNARA